MKQTLLFCLVVLCLSTQAQKTRDFYYADYPRTADSVKYCINLALNKAEIDHPNQGIFGLIVPHIWSERANEVTSKAFKYLEGKEIGTVYILCNSHFEHFEGISIESSDFWKTPLGKVEVDRNASDQLVNGSEIVKYYDNPHKEDHTLERMIPFLQVTSKSKFKIVPILFGNSLYIGKDMNNHYKILADLIHKQLKPNDLIIVSNDMTHFYLNTDEFLRIDQTTLNLIEEACPEKLVEFENELINTIDTERQILSCAIDGIKTLMELAKLNNVESIHKLDYGKRVRDNNTFVGFSSVIFLKD